MLNRALPLDANGARNTVVFADVPAGTELATAVVNLAAADITQGCASEPKPRFCPDKPLSRAQMASFLARSPISFDPSSDDDDDDDGEVRSDGREVRIRVGKPSTRCPQDVTCWGLHRDYHYEFIGDFGPAPYTLECWVDDRRVWSGIWSGRSTRGCYMWGDGGEIVYVVVDGVKSNELRWAQPDDEEIRPDDEEAQHDGRKVRIEWGDDLSSDPDPHIRDWCLGFAYCRDFSYELSGFGPPPYTLACWLSHENRPYKGPSSWAGPEYEDRKERCRVRGKFRLVPYVVVDGVKSNELEWPRTG